MRAFEHVPSGGGGGGGSPLNPNGEREGCVVSTAHQFERECERVLGERDVGAADAESRRHLDEAKVMAEAERAVPVKEHLMLCKTFNHQKAQRSREHSALMARATDTFDRLDRLDHDVSSPNYSLLPTAAAASPSTAAAASDHRDGRTPAAASTAAANCSDETEESSFVPERSSPFLALMEQRKRLRMEAQEFFDTSAAACGNSTDGKSSFISERSSPFLALMEARERFRAYIALYD